MATAPTALLQAIVQFLRQHPPFDQIAAAPLEAFAAAAKMGYYAQGTHVISPDAGVVKTLFLIERGLVHGRPPGERGANTNKLEFDAGEAFPIAAVFGARATTLEYLAIEDTFTYEFDAAAVDALARASPEFQHFCTRHVDTLLQRATAQLREVFASTAFADQPMTRTLSSVIRRAPITCEAHATLQQGLEIMARQRIGAIVIVDGATKPIGIFTERDLVRTAAAGQLVLGRPILEFATRQLVTLPSSALVADAAVEMAQRSIRHILVVEEERLAGVVSERDLFALQRLTMGQVASAIAGAEAEADLVRAAEEIRRLADSLLAQGIGAESLTKLISTLNDRLTHRVLELERTRHSLDDVRLCWLALGSEGRHEQTFATDQDNAVLFVPPAGEPVERTRERLLPFARAVNRTLDACGFPLCKGNVMGSNPELCLAADEWRMRFDRWIRSPTPEALLSASIMFDFRPLWGETALADALRAWLAEAAKDQQMFLRLLAEDALRTRAPIGFFGDLVTSGKALERGTIDLKLQGTRLFVDAARLYSLALGVTATNTAERLRRNSERLGIKREDVDATVDAFHFVLMLRLRQQRLSAGAANRVDPQALNELDRRILKEALRRAQTMQQRLALDYRL
jgi:CBS domain-containing protein